MRYIPSATILTTVLVCSAAFLTEGCAKKVAVAKQTAPAPAMAPPATPAPAATPASTPAATRMASNTPSQTPDKSTRDRIQELIDRIQDAYFDYNTASIRKDAQSTLSADAVALSQILKQYPSYKITVEGFCDERGSGEYNLALGETRAQHAKSFLVDSGVPAAQVLTVSFGKEQQLCSEHDEACWQKNRRVHIIQSQS